MAFVAEMAPSVNQIARCAASFVSVTVTRYNEGVTPVYSFFISVSFLSNFPIIHGLKRVIFGSECVVAYLSY